MSRFRVLHILIAFALLGFLIWKADVQDIGDVLESAEIWPLLAVVALDAPALVLLFVRARYVLLALGHDVPARVLLPVSILGNVAGSLTPASVGELLRAAVLHTHADVTPEDSLALVFYERALSLFLLALGTGVVAAFLALSVPWAAGVAVVGLVFLFVPVLAARLFVLGGPAEPVMRQGLWGMFDRMMRSAAQIQALFADPALLARWAGLTAMIFVINAVQFQLLTHSVSEGVSLPEAWVAFGASQLAGIASLLPLGLGAVDGSLAGVLRTMGLSYDESTATAVLFRLTITVPLGIVAIASYAYLLTQTPKQPRNPDVLHSPVPGGLDVQ